jgi:N utilization substance protein A
LIKEVRNQGRGPEIIVSRADKNFLIRLFELEVPEIYDGIVEIKTVAREAGERSKIAVESIDRRIDAVGACVGMKGVRIQAIVRELNNEKIDIINFSSEPEIFISRALTPAKPVKIIVNREEQIAVAVIPEDQISLAIGKGGQNLKLASELTGYQIEPIRESEYAKQSEEGYITLEELEDFPETLKKKLLEANVVDVFDVRELGKEGLLEIQGIGEKTAEKILQLIENIPQENMEEEEEE